MNYQQTRIWDLPTRVSHWLLLTSFIIAWLTQGDDRYLDIHVFSGYLLLGLLIFRLLWGLIGSHYARFHSFTFGKTAVWHYLKTLPTSQRQHFLGHNPAGSWAIFLILTLALIVSITGLLTLGGEEQHGPFAGLLSFEWGEKNHNWHEIAAWTMLGIVGVHLFGVITATGLHRENLIKAMITGCKTTTTAVVSVPRHGRWALFLIFAVLMGSGYYFKGYLNHAEEHPYLPFVGPTLPDNALWRAECGDCHLTYHPTLLPARSWQRMMAEQHNHFEEDLYLDTETVTKIETFLVQNAAESVLTEPAWKIHRTTPVSQTPLRITALPYWQTQHQKIPETIWQHPQVRGKAHCQACHLDADKGTFEDSAMKLPH